MEWLLSAGRQYHGCSALTVLLGGIDRVSYQLKSRKGTPSYFIKVYFWPKFPGYLPWVNSLTGVGKDRADFIGTSIPAVQLGSGRPHGEMIQKWFDTSKFVPNAVGTFGNSGKSILRAPKFFGTDLGLIKNTKVTEKTSVQFRAEFFNALNNVNFGFPDSTVTSGTFGQITSAASPRILQFALKFIF